MWNRCEPITCSFGVWKIYRSPEKVLETFWKPVAEKEYESRYSMCCDLYKAYTLVHNWAPEYLNCNEASPGIFSSNWSTAFVVIWLHMLRSRYVRLWPCFARSIILVSVMLSHLDASNAIRRWRWIATNDTPMSVIAVHPLNVRCSRVWRFSATSVRPTSVTCSRRKNDQPLEHYLQKAAVGREGGVNPFLHPNLPEPRNRPATLYITNHRTTSQFATLADHQVSSIISIAEAPDQKYKSM